MAILKSFEDLECWQEARQLVKLIFLSCEMGKLARDREFARDLKDAAVILISRIADGRFDDAQGALFKIRNIAYVLDDLDYIPIRYVDAIQKKSESVAISIIDFRRRAENRDKLTDASEK